MIKQNILLELECYFDFCFILLYPVAGVIENGTKEKSTIRISHQTLVGDNYRPTASNFRRNQSVP